MTPVLGGCCVNLVRWGVCGALHTMKNKKCFSWNTHGFERRNCFSAFLSQEHEIWYCPGIFCGIGLNSSRWQSLRVSFALNPHFFHVLHDLRGVAKRCLEVALNSLVPVLGGSGDVLPPVVTAAHSAQTGTRIKASSYRPHRRPALARLVQFEHHIS